MLRTGLTAYIGTIRAAPIRVRAIVVVGIARGVDIPRIVGVAAISRPQTAILSLAYTPVSSNKLAHLFTSEVCHAFMSVLVSHVRPTQYFTRFDDKWKTGFARKISLFSSPHRLMACL